MTVIPLSPSELIQAILTVILIYVSWKNSNRGSSGNTKK